MLFQIDGTISKISFIHHNNYELLQSLADNMYIESFQAGDIIIKQNDIGRKFYFIIEGLAEVFLENEDYEFFNPDLVKEYFGELKLKNKGNNRKDKYEVNEEISRPLATESHFNNNCKEFSLIILR